MKDPAESKLRTASRLTAVTLRNLDTRSVLAELAEPLVPIPPDGGWGWVIVVVSTFNMFCIDGVAYCYALFFKELSSTFNCTITDIAVLTALSGGFYYLIGPLTCSALNRFGFQIIAVVGGACACAAFVSASFLTSLWPFLVISGIIAGTAFNLMYTPSVIAIGFYFERWRALAMAICCCGSSLGVMVSPIIFSELLTDVDWRIKYRIIAGVFGLCSILGLVYKPIKSSKVERNVQFCSSQMTSPNTSFSETELGTGIAGVFQRFKNALFPTISEVSGVANTAETSKRSSKSSSLAFSLYLHKNSMDEEDITSTYLQADSQETIGIESARHHTHGDHNKNVGCVTKCRQKFERSSTSLHCCHCCMKRHQVSFTEINRPLYRDDIFYGGSVYGLAQLSNASVPVSRGIPSLAYTLSVSRAATQRDLEEQTECVCCPEAVLRVLTTMLHFQMFKSPAFLVLLFSGYLSLMGTYVAFTYVGECAVSAGLGDKFGVRLLSVIGIANTLGRATCGVLSCFPVLDMNIISWVTICLSGISITMVAFATTELYFTICCAVFGFTLASFAVLRALVFVELFGLENLTNCFGLNMVFQSLAAFSGTPIANVILKQTNSFQAVFIFTGVSIMTSGIILIPVKRLLKWEQKHKKKVTFVR